MKKLLAIVWAMFLGIAYADTETINWYVDGSAYTTTTCEIGGDITLPAAPPKRGYNFTGWQVLLYDFSTLDPDVNADSTSNAGIGGGTRWSGIFSYGTVAGKTLCSTTGGKAGAPDETGDGVYCWCKATAYKPAGSNLVYENASISPWVFRQGCSSASTCAYYCNTYCKSILTDAASRRAIFGITQ